MSKKAAYTDIITLIHQQYWGELSTIKVVRIGINNINTTGGKSGNNSSGRHLYL
jgi:hypothetical protein